MLGTLALSGFFTYEVCRKLDPTLPLVCGRRGGEGRGGEGRGGEGRGGEGRERKEQEWRERMGGSEGRKGTFMSRDDV